MSVKSFYSGGREWFGRKARNIEGLSYFYLFIFILPPYNDKVTKYTKIHKMARIKAQRNHDRGFHNVGFLY